MRGSHTLLRYVTRGDPMSLGPPLKDCLVGPAKRFTVSKNLFGRPMVTLG